MTNVSFARDPKCFNIILKIGTFKAASDGSLCTAQFRMELESIIEEANT